LDLVEVSIYLIASSLILYYNSKAPSFDFKVFSASFKADLTLVMVLAISAFKVLYSDSASASSLASSFKDS